MPLVIPDESLEAAGLDAREAKIQIACRWFDEDRMSIGHAARLAGLSVNEFEEKLHELGIPRYRYTEEMLKQDSETLERLDDSPEAIDRWEAECESMGPLEFEPGERERFEAILREADAVAKAQVRHDMGLGS